MTFFSEIKTKFLTIAAGEDIPTENFLLSFSEIVPFFGKYSYMNVSCLQTEIWTLVTCILPRYTATSVVILMSVVPFCRYVGPHCVQTSEIRCQWKHRGNCWNVGGMSYFCHLTSCSFCFRDCRRSLTLHETASQHCRVLLTVRLPRVQAKEVNHAPWPCCGWKGHLHIKAWGT